MAYRFEYESTRARSLARRRRRGRRAEGIVFDGTETRPRSYFYDLRARHPVAARVKRLVDVLGSTVLITLLAPLLLALIALIKLTSPGPAVFRQRRIGFRANPFDMYKFRTMVVGAHLMEEDLAEKAGGHFLKLERDPRVTPIGGFLRRYSLDELPQLFNVLEGTMSLVGPRPLLASDLNKLSRRSNLRRFSMHPGITGLWQVSGRSRCTEEMRLRLDREYVDRWSLGLDFRILVRTVRTVLSGKDAV